MTDKIFSLLTLFCTIIYHAEGSKEKRDSRRKSAGIWSIEMARIIA
jgi:hypothetical protein